MNFVPAGVALAFEVTYDSPSLFVAMRVFDDSGQVGAPIAMTNFFGNSYVGKFTPDVNKAYRVNKAVYTDGTFTAVDSNYSQGSDSFNTGDFASGGSSAGQIVAVVEQPPEITAIVEPNEILAIVA